MTTYTSFVTDLAALTITGVTRKYVMGETPPASLNAAEMPAMWVQAPSGASDPTAFCTTDDWPRFKAQLVIAMMPDSLSNMAIVWQDCVTMMDNVVAALGAEGTGQMLARSGTSWNMRLGTVTVAGAAYWAVVVDVTAEG